MSSEGFQVRPAKDEDRYALTLLLAAVAEERDGIAPEPPIDLDARAAGWRLAGTFVAVARNAIVGEIGVRTNPFGYGDVAMMVAADWRRRGVGSALMAAAIQWSRAHGLHKLSLGVFPHNDAALALYRKFGFVQEGYLRQHIGRTSGERWDVIEMGLFL